VRVCYWVELRIAGHTGEGGQDWIKNEDLAWTDLLDATYSHTLVIEIIRRFLSRRCQDEAPSGNGIHRAWRSGAAVGDSSMRSGASAGSGDLRSSEHDFLSHAPLNIDEPEE